MRRIKNDLSGIIPENKQLNYYKKLKLLTLNTMVTYETKH